MSKVLKAVGTVGKAAAVTASVAGLGYVAGSTYVAKKTHDGMDRCVSGLADDLTHIMVHGMSSGPLEEQLSLRGHEKCETRRPRRFLNNESSKGNEYSGPEF